MCRFSDEEFGGKQATITLLDKSFTFEFLILRRCALGSTVCKMVATK